MSQKIVLSLGGISDFFGGIVAVAITWPPPFGSEQLIDIPARTNRVTLKSWAEKFSNTQEFAPLFIGPQRYNELVKDMKSQRTVETWALSKLIADIYDPERELNLVLPSNISQVDLNQAVNQRGLHPQWIDPTRAPDELCLRVANLWAKFHASARLASLSQHYKLPIPHGANSNAIEAGALIVAKYGRKELYKISKVHFRSVQSVLARTRSL